MEEEHLVDALEDVNIISKIVSVEWMNEYQSSLKTYIAIRISSIQEKKGIKRNNNNKNKPQ